MTKAASPNASVDPGERGALSSQVGRRLSRKGAMADVAARLFLERGYDAMSLDMLIGEVGGSKRDVYSLFGSKDELFVEAITRLCETLRKPLHAFQLEGSTQEPAVALRAFGRELHRAGLTPQTLALQRLMLSEARRFPHLAWVVWRKGHEVSRRIVADWIEIQQQRHQLRAGDPLRLADQFVDMIVATAQGRMQLGVASVVPSQVELDAIVDDAVETFLAGRLAGPAAPTV